MKLINSRIINIFRRKLKLNIYLYSTFSTYSRIRIQDRLPRDTLYTPSNANSNVEDWRFHSKLLHFWRKGKSFVGTEMLLFRRYTILIMIESMKVFNRVSGYECKFRGGGHQFGYERITRLKETLSSRNERVYYRMGSKKSLRFYFFLSCRESCSFSPLEIQGYN